MLVLKCVMGAILGAILGLIAFIVGFFSVWLIVGLALQDSGKGEAIAGLTLFLIPAGIVVGIRIPIREGAKRRQTAEAAHREEQRGYRNRMAVLGEQSLGLFESMPNRLRAAEGHLDQATTDFAEGAFAPFWDSIEKAANTLGGFDAGVRDIKDNLSRYTNLIGSCEDIPPEFPLARQSVAKLGVAAETAERMQAIVRNAQRNFQFATIYEQRKTNKILVAGFANLARALEGMTWQITASIDDLAGSVGEMTSTLSESMRAIPSRMGELAETTARIHEELRKEASEGAVREQRAVEMLDNIQRRRRPFP